jgi:hypothetical protein
MSCSTIFFLQSCTKTKMEINVNGIIFSFIITLLKYFSAHICMFINKKLFQKSTSQKFAQLRDELRELIKVQQKIDQIDEFAQHALIQRKINKINDQIENEIKQNRSAKLTTNSYIKLTYNIVLVVLSILLIWFNKDKPIIDLSSTIDSSTNTTIFYPFDSLMAFPSVSRRNSIGLTVWLFTTNRLLDIVFNKINLSRPVFIKNKINSERYR